MALTSYYPVLMTRNVAATADFYQRHFGFGALFTADWYVHLQSTEAGAAVSLAVLDGADAYLDAMAVSGRTRLLLIEGPAALGREAMAALDAAHGEAALRAGLQAACVKGVDLDALAALLSAAFDRAALDLQAGGSRKAVSAALRWLLKRILHT